MAMDDKVLLNGLKQNERKAFNMLFDLLYPQLRFFTEQITKDMLEAEDLSNSFSYPQSTTINTHYTSLTPDSASIMFLPILKFEKPNQKFISYNRTAHYQ